jgi:chemotaxis protein CheD
MGEIIKVGMADLKVSNEPNILTTLGLGSCVGIALFDSFNKIIGLAHIMLPDSKIVRNNSNLAKFADTGIEKLLKEMLLIGANKTRIVAKIAGGAQMFAGISTGVLKIGTKNVEASKDKLQELKIPIHAEDTGGNIGRTISISAITGKLLIKTIGFGSKEI